MLFGNLEETEAGYRKGMVLGLTMAEIMLLLLFIILLFVTYEITKFKKESKDHVDEILILKEENSNLQESINDLRTTLEKEDPTDRLKYLSDRVEKLRDENTKLARDSTELAEVKEALISNEKYDDEINTSDEISDIISDMVAKQSEAEQLAQENEQLAQENEQIKDKEKDLINQLAFQKKKDGSGHGPPPCWMDDRKPPPGRSQYIYNIEITESGLIIHPNIQHVKIPDRKDDLLRLDKYVAEIPLKQEISVSDFMNSTKALDDYQRKKVPECRHTVRYYDKTGDGAKDAFKAGQGAIYQRFHYLLIEKLSNWENYVN